MPAAARLSGLGRHARCRSGGCPDRCRLWINTSFAPVLTAIGWNGSRAGRSADGSPVSTDLTSSRLALRIAAAVERGRRAPSSSTVHWYTPLTDRSLAPVRPDIGGGPAPGWFQQVKSVLRRPRPRGAGAPDIGRGRHPFLLSNFRALDPRTPGVSLLGGGGGGLIAKRGKSSNHARRRTSGPSCENRS